LGPPELLDLASAGNLPAFLDQPAFPAQPAFLDQPAFPAQPSFPAQPAAGGPARPTGSGRRRARAAALTAVAVVVAALAGWFAYPRPGNVAGASGFGSGAGTAPAGYRWYQVSAASSGTTAGFQIAVPASWTISRSGLASYLRPPEGSAHVEISLASFTYARPLREAAFLQAQAIQLGHYPGYRLIAIRPGTLRGSADAAWRFSWQGGGATRTGVLEVLASIDTAAGTQPYTLAVSAPSDTFPAAERVFLDVMQTFRPLP
jgi:hypothetical protein